MAKVTRSLATPESKLLTFNPGRVCWEASGSTYKGTYFSPNYSLGSQSSLNEVIQSLAATKFVKVEHTQCILYVTPETARKLLPSLLETKNLHVGYGTPKAM